MKRRESNIWKQIWDAKYNSNQNKPAHVLDGFDALTKDQWSLLTRNFLKLINIEANMDILEIGCGAGAFLEKIKPHDHIFGVDYSENAIRRAKAMLNGNFCVADAAELPFCNQSFDTVLSFSTFFYFDNLIYAERVLFEMLRVMRIKGCIFICDVNDADKKELYNQIRNQEKRNHKHIMKSLSPGHLFYKKSFFNKFAKQNQLNITIVDENNLGIPFYSNAKYRYSVVLHRI
jgi:ubiquinone/menaquinone biosynthesis C-methylase UbiE